MTMEIKTSITLTSERTTVEAIEVGPSVEVQRITVTRQTGGNEPVSQFMETVVSNNAPVDPNYGRFVVVEPELLFNLRFNGWFRTNQDYKLISKNPFSRVLANLPYEVIRLKDHDSSAYDVHGNRLPVAVRFNYIDGRVSDYSFDLTALQAHLEARKDVTLVPGPNGKLIQSIPYYNAGDTTGNYGFNFIWHPDAKAFQKYINLSAKGDFLSRRNIAHTLMGNDKFRIQHPEE